MKMRRDNLLWVVIAVLAVLLAVGGSLSASRSKSKISQALFGSEKRFEEDVISIDKKTLPAERGLDRFYFEMIRVKNEERGGSKRFVKLVYPGISSFTTWDELEGYYRPLNREIISYKELAKICVGEVETQKGYIEADGVIVPEKTKTKGSSWF